MGPTIVSFKECIVKYKFKFDQYVNGVETCEAVIEADSIEEALTKYHDRLFRTYLIMKADVERKLVEDFEPEVTLVREDD